VPGSYAGRSLVGRLRAACGWRARHIARLRKAGAQRTVRNRDCRSAPARSQAPRG
jgi:hypothetical protein